MQAASAPTLLPISSALKLARADAYVDELLTKVERTIGNKHPSIGFAREYSAKDQAIIFRASRLPEIRDEWALLLGDAIHNFRCALDHLWWALALKRLGREPTEREAREVQFPIIDKPNEWGHHRFLKHVNPKAADEVNTLQVFNGRDELSMIDFLSNRDKHRLIQPALYTAGVAAFVVPADTAYIDCTPHPDPFAFIHSVELKSVYPKLNQEALRIRITPVGPNPDLDYEPYLAGSIVIGNDWEIRDALTRINDTTREVLTRCQQFL